MPQSPDYRVDEEYFRNRFDREPWIFTWLRQQQYSDFWRKESLKFKTPLEVPAYLIGGLLDGYRDFVLEVSATSKAPVIAEIGPWNHASPEYGCPDPTTSGGKRPCAGGTTGSKAWTTGYWTNPAAEWHSCAPATRRPRDLATIPGYWRCGKQWPVEGGNSRRLYPQTARQLVLIHRPRKAVSRTCATEPAREWLPADGGANRQATWPPTTPTSLVSTLPL